MFGSIKYETEGTYNYTITERDDHVAGITYDTTAHNVVVTVAKDKDGNKHEFGQESEAFLQKNSSYIVWR